jgi:hypothetical protein
MKKPLLFSTLGLLLACQPESNVSPAATSLAAEVAGLYRTNVYLDPACLAIPTEQMPYVELKAESANSVTLVYTKLYPAKAIQSFEHVIVQRQAEAIEFRLAGASIGTLQTDRLFTSNGMEKQGNLLRVSMQHNPQNTVYFAGSR